MNHILKITPSHFEAIKDGSKKFEIRGNSDRGFQKGDTVELCEYVIGAIAGKYTGRTVRTEIIYVSDFNQPQNQVVFGFDDIHVFDA